MVVRTWLPVLIVLVSCKLILVNGKRKAHAHVDNNIRIFIYVSIGIFVFAIGLCCSYICKRLFPKGIQFTAIELDDIKIDRLDDIESNLQSNIKVLKDRLTFHRKKKTAVQTERDIKIKVNERAELFNQMGRSKYGNAWDAGTVPHSDIIAMTQDEVKFMKQEIKNITKERKKEETRDLWALWEEEKAKDAGPEILEHKEDAPLLPKRTPQKQAQQREPTEEKDSGEDAPPKERDMWALWNEVRGDGGPQLRSSANRDQFADNRTDRSDYSVSSNSKYSRAPPVVRNPVQELQPLVGNKLSSLYERDQQAADAYKVIGRATKAPPHIKPPPKKDTGRSVHGVQGEGGAYSLDLDMPDYGLKPASQKVLPPVREAIKEAGRKPLERPGTTPDKAKVPGSEPPPPLRALNRPPPPSAGLASAIPTPEDSASVTSSRKETISQALNHSLVRPAPPRGPPPGFKPGRQHILASDDYSLALSPGFFRFYAHIGVLAALEERGCLRPDAVSGSSAGALVGCFLAAGMTPRDMIEYVLKIKRSDIWDMGGIGGLLKGKLFEEVTHDNLPVKTFEECEIPLGVTAYSLLGFKTKSITSGNIAKAVVASCCFPGLFQPVSIDGLPHIDGGVFDDAGLMALPDAIASRSSKSSDDDDSNKLVVNVVFDARGTPSIAKMPAALKNRRLLTILMENVPMVHPFSMDTMGIVAFESARAATLKALDGSHMQEVEDRHWVCYVDASEKKGAPVVLSLSASRKRSFESVESLDSVTGKKRRQTHVVRVPSLPFVGQMACVYEASHCCPDTLQSTSATNRGIVSSGSMDKLVLTDFSHPPFDSSKLLSGTPSAAARSVTTASSSSSKPEPTHKAAAAAAAKTTPRKRRAAALRNKKAPMRRGAVKRFSKATK